MKRQTLFVCMHAHNNIKESLNFLHMYLEYLFHA